MRVLQSLLEQCLTRYVSPPNARAIAGRALLPLSQRQQSTLTHEDYDEFFNRLRDSLRLFVSDTQILRIIDEVELRVLHEGSMASSHHSRWPIREESDLRAARVQTRDLCLAFSTSPSSAHRMATVVSELARNILSYTPGGEIAIWITRGTPSTVRIVAEDQGKGIADLNLVLSGRYKSSTGMGRGLIGVKRLLDRIQIHTDDKGTRIEGEAELV